MRILSFLKSTVVIGYIMVAVDLPGVSDRKHTFRLYIMNKMKNELPLMGRNWLDALFPNWRENMKMINFNIAKKINDISKKFPNVICKNNETVVVSKPNGNIWICIDCKRTINPYLKVDYYPLPKPIDIFTNLANCEYFCVIDLTSAYQQLPLTEKSNEYVTINTFRGLYSLKLYF